MHVNMARTSERESTTGSWRMRGRRVYASDENQLPDDILGPDELIQTVESVRTNSTPEQLGEPSPPDDAVSLTSVAALVWRGSRPYYREL